MSVLRLASGFDDSVRDTLQSKVVVLKSSDIGIGEARRDAGARRGVFANFSEAPINSLALDGMRTISYIRASEF